MNVNVTYSKLHLAIVNRIVECGADPVKVIERINSEIEAAETDADKTKASVAVKTRDGAKSSYAIVRTKASNASVKIAITPALRIAELSDMAFEFAGKFARIETMRLPESVETWLKETESLHAATVGGEAKPETESATK